MATQRHLQFRRNQTVYPNYESAKTAIESLATTKKDELLDGEILIARYTFDSKVASMIGVVHKTSGDAPTVTITLLDSSYTIDNIYNAISGAVSSLTEDIEDAVSALTLTSPEKTLVVNKAASGTTAEVNHDKVTIKQSTGNTYDNGDVIADDLLYAADAVIEDTFTVLGGTVGQLTSGTKISGGTTVIELLKKMLVKEADCTPVNPTATLAIDKTTTPVEVGTVLSEKMTVTYTDGKFTGSTDDYGYEYSVNAGCSAGNITYKRGSTTLATQAGTSYTDSDYTIVEGNNTWSVSEKYGASTVTPKKNNGEDSTQKIAAGTTATSSKTVKGQYKYYYGGTTASTIDAVTTAGLSTGWTTVDGTTQVIGASTKYTLPKNYFIIMCQSKYKLNTIQDYIFGTDYKANFTVTGTKTINIGGTSTATYNVYIWTKDPASQPETKNITLAKA